MPKITNNTRETLSFTTGVKDGAAVTESLKAGETRDIKVDADDAQVRGRALAGVISIDGDSPAVSKRSPQSANNAADRRTAQTLGGDAPVRE